MLIPSLWMYLHAAVINILVDSEARNEQITSLIRRVLANKSCVLEVPGSILDQEMLHPYWGFSWCYSVPPLNCRHSIFKRKLKRLIYTQFLIPDAHQYSIRLHNCSRFLNVPWDQRIKKLELIHHQVICAMKLFFIM